MPRHSRWDLSGAPKHAAQRVNNHRLCFLREQNSRSSHE